MAEHRHVVAPCGLGARDVLRLEAGMPLLRPRADRRDHAAASRPRLGGEVREARVHRESRARGASRRRRTIRESPVSSSTAACRPAPATGCCATAAVAGEIRSGSIAPSVGNRSIATALLDPASATVGTRLGVEVRGTEHPATHGRITVLQARRDVTQPAGLLFSKDHEWVKPTATSRRSGSPTTPFLFRVMHGDRTALEHGPPEMAERNLEPADQRGHIEPFQKLSCGRLRIMRERFHLPPRPCAVAYGTRWTVCPEPAAGAQIFIHFRPMHTKAAAKPDVGAGSRWACDARRSRGYHNRGR